MAASTRVSTIPNSDAFCWVIGPAGRCVSSVAQGIFTASQIHRTIASVANQSLLLQFAHEKALEKGGYSEELARWMREQVDLSKWAIAQMQSDLHDLHFTGVISLWTSLEVAVEDTAILILVKDQTIIPTLQASGLKLSKNVIAASNETDARRVYVQIERQLRGPDSKVAAFCRVLQNLGIAVHLPADVEAKIRELNYVRNCLLHRGGIVDELVSTEAPALNLAVDKSIRVGRDAHLSYYEAVSTFAKNLLQAAIQSHYVRSR
jgi:hypothetical protein